MMKKDKTREQKIRERIQFELEFAEGKVESLKKEMKKGLLKTAHFSFEQFGRWQLEEGVNYQEQLWWFKSILKEKNNNLITRIQYEVESITEDLLRFYDVMNSTDLFSNAVNLTRQKSKGQIVLFFKNTLKIKKEES